MFAATDNAINIRRFSKGATSSVFSSHHSIVVFVFSNCHINMNDAYSYKGVAGGGGGGSWCARDALFVSLFLSKQPTIFRGENAMTKMFDTV